MHRLKQCFVWLAGESVPWVQKKWKLWLNKIASSIDQMNVTVTPDARLVMLEHTIEVKTYSASTPQMYRSCGMCADCEIPDHSILVWINQLLLYDFCYSTFILNLTASIWHNEAYSPFFSPNASQIICIIICFKWRSNWNGLENHQLLNDRR